MARRQKSGSVVCPSCGRLVGVNDDKCFHCGRAQPGMWGFATWFRSLGQDLGFVQLVMFGCGALYVVSLLLSQGQQRGSGVLSFLSPSIESLFLLGGSGAVPFFVYDRWWTVLSAGWLHGGIVHIFFNLMWIRSLGPATAELYGAARMVILYTIAGAVGFLLSSLTGALAFLPQLVRGAPYTVGASASIFGLLAALVYYGRRSGSSVIGRQAKNYAVILAIFGLLFPGIDNWAHAGGFLGGYLAARWLDPLQRERTDHVILALICLFLTATAIVASVWTGARFVG